MRFRVLGCSGGIGGRDLRTTSFLVDQDILIDAGTGVGDLDLGELVRIDHIFVTHAHLDHVAAIPLLIDAVGYMRAHPVTVYAAQGTIAALRRHLFNWVLWPDFTAIPSAQAPLLRFAEVEIGRTITIAARHITPLPARHTVPAVGYNLDSGRASLAFTGDTGVNDSLWQALDQVRNLEHLVIETAFSSRDRDLAHLSGHLCPETLASQVAKLGRRARIHITHLKPGESETTMEEIGESIAGNPVRRLLTGDVIEF